MADYVLDSRVLVQRLIHDTYTPNVQVLFRQLTSNDTLFVPEFCLMECANVLWKQVRFHRLPQPQAEQLLRDLQALPLRRAPTKGLLMQAFQIGLKHQLAIYDSSWQWLNGSLSPGGHASNVP